MCLIRRILTRLSPEQTDAFILGITFCLGVLGLTAALIFHLSSLPE